jgi:hypothetical protein
LGSKYSTQAISGYNSSPPSDDGSTAATNRVAWSTIKTKLTDPPKNQAGSIDSAIVTALDTSPRAITGSDSTIAGDHWRTIQVNTATVVVTLADAATMTAGYIVNVANQSAGDITVNLASAGDTIDGVTNTTNTISAKEVREYIVNSTARGYITKSRTVVAATTAIAGLHTTATQAQQEAGSVTTAAVTPGQQQSHPSAAKAWASYDSVPGTPTLDVSYNVSSLTDNGTGDITVNFTTAFSSSNFAAVTGSRSPLYSAGAGQTLRNLQHLNTFATGSIRIVTYSYVGSTNTVAVEDMRVCVACFGDQ